MSFRFIAGPDDFLVQRKAREEWVSIAKKFSDPNSLEEVDGQAGNIEEAVKAVNRFISAVQTVSMFTPDKAVWFKNITFLADSVTGRSKTTLEAVERMQDLLDNFDNPAVEILVSASPVDRRKKAYKWFHSNGNSLFLEAGKDETALLAMLNEEATAAGKQFVGNAAQILIELIGGSTRLGLEETQKLITYLGTDKTEITPALVAELVPSIGDSDFFEAAEAFHSLDMEWALEAVHRHFFAGHDARPLISTLQNKNRLLIQLKAMQAGGGIRGRISKADLERAASRYGEYFGDSKRKSSFNIFTQNPWYLGKLSEILPNLSLKSLIEFQDAFRDAFMEIISRPNEQEAVLSGMTVRCLAPLQTRSA